MFSQNVITQSLGEMKNQWFLVSVDVIQYAHMYVTIQKDLSLLLLHLDFKLPIARGACKTHMNTQIVYTSIQFCCWLCSWTLYQHLLTWMHEVCLWNYWTQYQWCFTHCRLLILCKDLLLTTKLSDIRYKQRYKRWITLYCLFIQYY